MECLNFFIGQRELCAQHDNEWVALLTVLELRRSFKTRKVLILDELKKRPREQICQIKGCK